MGESTAARIVRNVTGMWWPAADSGQLRAAASAWTTMATALDAVAAPADQAARSVIEGNQGTAIDAFRTFWNRYDDGGGTGWLPQTAHACRQMGKALDDFADEVDKAVQKLEEEAAIVGATLVAGTALAIFTAGISEAAAGAATAGIIAAADALGVAVSDTVASIAATTLTGAAFGAVESVAVDAAVAQPIRIAFGDGGFSGSELLTAAEIGGLGGAAAGGLSSGARALSQAADGVEDASIALTGISKIATGLDTTPGRMLIGGATGAGQDALFNDGHINPLDVTLGAIGGAAARPAKNNEAPKPLVRKESLPTKKLGDKYVGENDPTDPNRHFYPSVVEYMSPQQLEAHRLYSMDGKLHWAADGKLFDTREAGTLHSGPGRAMFVMDEHGNLYASPEQEVGLLHHSSFLSGNPVAGAGEIVAVGGVPTVVSRKSGHYEPLEEHQQRVREMLGEQGIDVSGITFEDGF